MEGSTHSDGAASITSWLFTIASRFPAYQPRIGLQVQVIVSREWYEVAYRLRQFKQAVATLVRRFLPAVLDSAAGGIATEASGNEEENRGKDSEFGLMTGPRPLRASPFAGIATSSQGSSTAIQPSCCSYIRPTRS